MDLTTTPHSVHGPDVYYVGKLDHEMDYPWDPNVMTPGPVTMSPNIAPAGGVTGGYIFQLDEGPSFKTANYGPYCVTDPPVNLADPLNTPVYPFYSYPSGTLPGTWSGAGVSAGGVFAPGNAGVGTHPVTYGVNYGSCYLSQLVANIDVFEHPWPKHPETVGSEWGRGICADTDPTGYYMGGRYRNGIEFDPVGTAISFTTAGGTDGYLVRYTDCGIDWAFSFGTSANNEDISTIRYNASNDKVYIGGTVRGNFPITGFTDLVGNIWTSTSSGLSMTSGISLKGFVAQIEPSTGEIDWLEYLGDFSGDRTIFRNMRFGVNGELYVAAVFEGNITVGGTSHTNLGISGTDALLIQMNTSGTVTASSSFGTTGSDNIRSVAVRQNGSDYICLATGNVPTSTMVTFGGSTYPTLSGTGSDAFLASWGVSGTSLTPSGMNIFGGNGVDEGHDIVSRTFTSAVSSTTDCIYITGRFADDLKYTGPNMASVGNTTSGASDFNAFILGLDVSTNPKFLKIGGGPYGKDVGSQLLLANGRVYAVGRYGGTATGFLSGMTSIATHTDIYMGQFEYDGTSTVFDQVPGNGANDHCFDIEAKGDDLYICGQFGGGGTGKDLVFDNITIYSGSTRHDAFYARKSTITGLFFDVHDPEETSTYIDDIDQVMDGNEISIFPNPTNGLFFIEGLEEGIHQLTVRDYTGKVVFETRTATSKVNMDLSSLAEGIYLLEVSGASGTTLHKLMLE